jgi:predicted dehydrogenase
MKILVVGYGSIGQRHVRNLQLLVPDAQITVWRQHAKPISQAESDTLKFVYCLEDALAFAPDCALVCNPSPFHIETGIFLAEKNIHLFIEKPISNKLDGIDTLITMCQHRHLKLMVGYNFRFYPPLQIMRQAILDGKIGRILSVRAETGQYLPDWRPNRDYRNTVSAQKALGGGVLLEMSHELDYVRWLIGEVDQVYGRVALLSDLEMDVADIAEIILDFSNGAVGNIHLDMVQRAPTRTCKIIGSTGSLFWDAFSNQVGWFSADLQTWSDLHPVSDIDRNDMYVQEINHFLSCVRDDHEPLCTGSDGVAALKIVSAVQRASDTGRHILLSNQTG